MNDEAGDPVVRVEHTTTDVGAAEDFMRRRYVAENRIRINGVAEDFLLSHSAVIAPALALGRLRFGADVTGEVVADPDDPLTVVQPVAGRVAYLESAYPAEAYVQAGDVVLFPPSDPLHVINERVDLATTSLGRAAVSAYATAMTGIAADDLTFEGLTPLTPDLGRYWAHTVAHVRDDVLADPWAGSQPILLAQAFQTLAAALLSNFANTALARATDPEGPPVRGDVPLATLREIADYLDTHADQPVGPGEIAALAGRPVNEVVESSRLRDGRHPAELLWLARLRGAHRDLLDADPDTGSVDAIAARWGFVDPARFRVAFIRATDGQTPEDTLRR